MKFTFNIYSSLLLIFFVNGLIFSVLLFKKGVEQDNPPSKWLSLFVFLCCLYICPWMLGHASWYFNQPYRDILFYVPTQQLFLMGPVIYFYTQSLLNPSFRFTKKQALHVLPAAAYLLYSLVVFVTDKVILNAYYFYADARDKDLDDWYQQAGWLSMVVYAVLSIRYYNSYKKLIYNVLSYADGVQFDWVKKYLTAFIFMQILRGVFLFLYPNWGSFADKWWYYFMFSILFYYIALTGYVNTIQSVLSFRLSTTDKKPVYWLEHAENTVENATEHPPQSFDMNDAEVPDAKNNAAWETLKQAIVAAIEAEKLYENPRLSLIDIANRLDTNPTTVSRVVNHSFQMNFNDFVNHYRVEAVKMLFDKGIHQKHTLLSIAYDCGFNSKTTFNRAFKKNTGLSPKEYLESLGAKS